MVGLMGRGMSGYQQDLMDILTHMVALIGTYNGPVEGTTMCTQVVSSDPESELE